MTFASADTLLEVVAHHQVWGELNRASYFSTLTLSAPTNDPVAQFLLGATHTHSTRAIGPNSLSGERKPSRNRGTRNASVPRAENFPSTPIFSRPLAHRRRGRASLLQGGAQSPCRRIRREFSAAENDNRKRLALSSARGGGWRIASVEQGIITHPASKEESAPNVVRATHGFGVRGKH